MCPYKNPEDAKARNKRYYKNHRVELLKKQRQYHEQNREKARERQRVWRRRNPHYAREWYLKNRARILEKARENREKDKIKIRARSLARRIPLGSVCEECEGTENLEHHHPDYSKPLKVVTVCHSCNKIIN